MDRIGLDGMVFFGHHGATDDERAVGQRFIVEVEMTLDLAPAGQSDRLEDTADYGDAYQIIKDIMEGPGHALLESLAERAAARLLDAFPITGVRVRVRKPSVPINGVLDAAWVEVTRTR